MIAKPISGMTSTDSTARQVQPEEIKIAWLCQDELDFETAKSLLDIVHDDLDYAWCRTGQMRGVDVALVCNYNDDDDDEYDTRTRWVINIEKYFPAIDAYLSVGRGGGFPGPVRDLRLGDVVISSGRKDHSLVSALDASWRIEPYKIFKKGDDRNKKLRLQTKIIENLEQHGINRPRWSNHYTSSETQARLPLDLLFEASYRHVGGVDDCEQCERGRTIPRKARPSLDPSVHHGKLVLTYRKLQNAIRRDELSEDYNVICSAKIRPNAYEFKIPTCIFIRGISNYNDSHEMAAWENISAVNAALCAREVVTRVSEIWDEESPKDDLKSDLKVLNPGSKDATDATPKASSSLPRTTRESEDTIVIDLVSKLMLSDPKLTSLYSSWSFDDPEADLSNTIMQVIEDMKHTTNEVLAQRIMNLVELNHLSIARMFIIGSEDFQGDSQATASAHSQTIDDSTKSTVRLWRRRSNPYDEDRAEEIIRKDSLDLLPKIELAETIKPADISDFFTRFKVCRRILVLSKAVSHKMTSLSIGNALRDYVEYGDGNDFVSIQCVLDWQVWNYVDQEAIRPEDIDFILTISGTLSSASVVQFGEYLSKTWKHGRHVLGTVKAIIKDYYSHATRRTDFQHQIYGHGDEYSLILQTRHADNHQDATQAIAIIEGSLNDVKDTLEAFAWVVATLRPNNTGSLLVSETKYSMAINSKNDTPQPHRASLSTVPSEDSIVSDPEIEGECWTALFKNSVLAFGFPDFHTDRPKGIKGLEVPLPLMAAFAGTGYPIFLTDRIAMAGESKLLLPTLKVTDSVQWHYIEGKNVFDQAVDLLKGEKPDTALRLGDLQSLANLRNFLGYCAHSEIHVGTASSHAPRILSSRVPQMGARIRIKAEGVLNVGISAHGFATFGTTGMWRLTGAERASIDPDQTSLYDRCRNSQQRPALLYDDAEARGFLVSELSVIVHIVANYLTEHSLLKDHRIPYAQVSADGGEAAFETIQKHQGLKVFFRIGEVRKYGSIVEDFLKIFQQRRLQLAWREKEIKIAKRKPGLLGWDFVDLKDKDYDFFARELTTNISTHRPRWWKLFKNSGTMIIFGRDIGCPIRPSWGHSVQICNSWAEPPTEKDLLISSVNCLGDLARVSCKDRHKYPGRFMLTDKIAWARPYGSNLFEPCTVNHISCNPVQKLKKVNSRLKNSSWNLGDLEPYPFGAVVFGEKPGHFNHTAHQFVGRAIPELHASSLFLILASILFVSALSISRLVQNNVWIAPKDNVPRSGSTFA